MNHAIGDRVFFDDNPGVVVERWWDEEHQVNVGEPSAYTVKWAHGLFTDVRASDLLSEQEYHEWCAEEWEGVNDE